MSDLGVIQFRVSRLLGRLITRVAALLTFGTMPPFVSASAVVSRGDEVLVVIDPIRGEPVLPGGHLKWAERPHEALVREVREETGYIVEPERLLGVYAGPEWAGEAGVVRVIYAARPVGGELASSPEGEARWMEVRELAASETRDAPLVRTWLGETEGAHAE